MPAQPALVVGSLAAFFAYLGWVRTISNTRHEQRRELEERLSRWKYRGRNAEGDTYSFTVSSVEVFPQPAYAFLQFVLPIPATRFPGTADVEVTFSSGRPPDSQVAEAVQYPVEWTEDSTLRFSGCKPRLPSIEATLEALDRHLENTYARS